MSYTPIEHYRFLCDAQDCHAASQIIAGIDLRDAAEVCKRYSWRIVMGTEKPIFTYCPKHYRLGKEMY